MSPPSGSPHALATPPPNFRKQSSDRASPRSSRAPSLLSLVPFFPLLIHLLTLPVSYTSVSLACSYLPPSLRSTICPTSASAPVSRSVDLVIAYYDEALERTKEHIDDVRKTPFVRARSNRVVLYNKGPKGEEEIRKGLGLRWTDEVVPLPNLGREGATYLTVGTIVSSLWVVRALKPRSNSTSSCTTTRRSPRLSRLSTHLCPRQTSSRRSVTSARLTSPTTPTSSSLISRGATSPRRGCGSSKTTAALRTLGR